MEQPLRDLLSAHPSEAVYATMLLHDMFLKIANLREVVVALLAYKWHLSTLAQVN